MPNKMLVDAAHPEETRVVVLRGSRVEEFDFESASRKQLRGNIYLAKVTRVEPSLQAAFVDYGGNRHGFLAFSEIHPDYYQIPIADRQALIDEEEREAVEAEKQAAEADEEAAAIEAAADSEAAPADVAIAAGTDEDTFVSEPAEFEALPRRRRREPRRDGLGRDATSSETGESEPATPAGTTVSSEDAAAEAHADAVEVLSDDRVESIGSEDALEELPERRRPRARQYKIQEVIKRRQVLLVQVVKEERGNKGAALTTYLSLAGRYSVLMPNTARGGGISPQDHLARRPQAPEGGCDRPRSAGGDGRHSPDGRCLAHQGRGQARLRVPDPPVGERPRADPQVDRPDAGL